MTDTMIETAKETWPEFFDGSSIKLGNKETLIKRYGKYEPCMCFLMSESNIGNSWMDIDLHRIDLNIEFDARIVEWIPGEFWVSKKGTRCFRPGSDGPHILVKASWGGCFENSRGEEYDEISPKAIYAKRAQSNGGGVGYNYYVFPKDFYNEVSIDDI